MWYHKRDQSMSSGETHHFWFQDCQRNLGALSEPQNAANMIVTGTMKETYTLEAIQKGLIDCSRIA